MRLDVIAGRFALCDPIAGGSTGTVWRAWDLKQRRFCAAKISNPAVLGRVVRLEELLTPALASADPASVAALLEEIAGSRPTLSTVQVRPAGTTPGQRAALALGEACDAETRRSAATTFGPRPMADILSAAAEHAASGAASAGTASASTASAGTASAGAAGTGGPG